MATQIYDAGTPSSVGTNTVTHMYDRAGIEAANEINIYQQWADKKSMKQKMGKTFKISKFLHIYDRAKDDAEFAAKGFLSSRSLSTVSADISANAALAEGAGAVNQVGIQKINMECSFARYGEMLPYTDEVELWSEDYIQTRNREELGRLANRRMEDLIQIDMLSTPTKMYANDETSVSALGTGILADDTNAENFQITFDLIRKASRKLVRNRCKKNTSIVTGSVKIDTRTVNKAFYSIVGPEVKYDLENITRGAGNSEELAFIPSFKYAANGKMADGEFGQMHDVKFIESETALVRTAAGAVVPQNYVGDLASSGGTDNTSATAADRDNFDVFPILIPTEGSFATVGLKGKNKIKFHQMGPLEALSNTNPYATNGFYSYNFFYAGIILDDTKLLEVDVLATA